MRLMRFHFKEINRVPGKKMYKADAISRSNVPVDKLYDKEMIVHVGSEISSLPGSDTRQQEIMEAQEEDPVCSSDQSSLLREKL